MNLEEIQDRLREEGLDGWLFFDHHERDPLAYRVLGFEPPRHVTRRWYYWIPAQGVPVKLVHRIESWMLDALPGGKDVYSGWQEQAERLQALLADARKLAMQYSPNCMIPYVSLVDGGTVDLVRSLGPEVVSSASLIQYFEARWTETQREMHFEAGRRIDGVLCEAFGRIGRKIAAEGQADEYEIAQFILDRFAEHNLVTDSGPAVSVNAHSGDPHYGPTAEESAPIRAGDFVLIDLWAKLDQPRSVYYDITWTGFCGDEPPAEIQNVFDVVVGARDAALAAADEAIREGAPLRGCDLDDIARGVIREAGLADRFVHRTGHSIGEEVHGNGANLDNIETRDERPIIPRTCFSIEPGVYGEKFGVRSELNCYVSESGAEATGLVQDKIVRIGG